MLDIFAIGGLEIFDNIITSAPTYNDDVAIQLGTGGTTSVIYETADANANALIFVAPEGGGTDVPAFIFGDASILNADLGWFNGLTEPSLVVVNDAKDAYIRIDAGDDGVAGSQGIYFKAAADEDIEIINLSVTGTPRVYWDESLDSFRSTKAGIWDAGILFLGDTANASMTTGLSINQGAADDAIFDLKSSDVAHALVSISETDSYFELRKAQANGGGIQMSAVGDAEAANALTFKQQAFSAKDADTTKSTAGRSIYEFSAYQHSAGSFANILADGNCFGFRAYVGGAESTVVLIDEDGDIWLNGGLTLGSASAVTIGTSQVVGARIVDARCDDTINSGDATTDGVIDALRDAMITHGLIAAA